jgi:hypothetical protein
MARISRPTFERPQTAPFRAPARPLPAPPATPFPRSPGTPLPGPWRRPFPVPREGPEAGAPLVGHPAVARVSFTGSVPTGRLVAAAAGAQFTDDPAGVGPLCRDIIRRTASLLP